MKEIYFLFTKTLTHRILGYFDQHHIVADDGAGL